MYPYITIVNPTNFIIGISIVDCVSIKSTKSKKKNTTICKFWTDFIEY